MVILLILDFKKRLVYFYRGTIFNKYLYNLTVPFYLDFIHKLHSFNDTDCRPYCYAFFFFYKRISARRVHRAEQIHVAAVRSVRVITCDPHLR